MNRFWREVWNDQSGSPAVEFGLIAPVLLLMLFGIVKFGIVLNNYIELSDGVRSGARQLAISRVNAGSASTPWTDTNSAVTSSAANLTKASITITMTVNGTACTNDSNCATALSAAMGLAASVTATYPCDLSIMGVNYAPSCVLSSQSTERIE